MKAARLPLLTCLAAAALLAAAPAAEAKIGASFAGGILTVSSGKRNDKVAVSCGADGLVKVNGRNPKAGAFSCSTVSEVDADMRAGKDRVDFSAVGAGFGQTNFPGFGLGTGTAALLGPGDDTYVGSPTAFNLVLGQEGNDRATGGGLRDQMTGGLDGDRMRGFGGIDTLIGKGGSDRLHGGDGNDLISGGGANDLLNGEAGDDFMNGGSGMDRLLGGLGLDHLFGGPDRDRLRGGPGDDVQQQK
jgi:Ca2+-binding RTX toxin-like protein